MQSPKFEFDEIKGKLTLIEELELRPTFNMTKNVADEREYRLNRYTLFSVLS